MKSRLLTEERVDKHKTEIFKLEEINRKIKNTFTEIEEELYIYTIKTNQHLGKDEQDNEYYV